MTQGKKQIIEECLTIQKKYVEADNYMLTKHCLTPTILNLMETNIFGLPFYGTSVSAGFPSPADDYLEGTIDLNEYLINHPSATFLVRASGHSMINAGIFDGDILVVDRSLKPLPGKVVIAAIDGQLTVKRLQKNPMGGFILLPENAEYQPIVVNEGNEVLIWGVVTCVLHSL
jgi:DNA polymerase V